jgi:DNA end-binding protein Ku
MAKKEQAKTGRSIWKGVISFGLVTIPVKLYPATEERDVAFHQVHATDGGRIRLRRVSTIDGEEIPYSDIAKGYELESGELVVLTDGDLADLPLSSSRAIEVLEFVPLEEVDPIYFARSYYVEPGEGGLKAYSLLREALERSGRVAVVKVALRQRESLAVLRVRDRLFVLELMLWPDEVRRPDFAFLDEEAELRPQEVKMASDLVEALADDFHPERYHDDYREALEALIEARVAGREVVQPPEDEEEAGVVVDLMAALKASVEAAKKERSKVGEAEAAGDGRRRSKTKRASSRS